MQVLFWGRSPYETDRDRELRDEAVRSLGLEPRHCASPDPQISEAAALVVDSKKRVDSALLGRAPKLRLVVTTTSGYDHIDLGTAELRGVAVVRCPMARRDAVVEMSLAMGIALLRRIPWLQSRCRDGVWARGELPTRSVGLAAGLRVGVIGHGVIGSRAAEVWRALGADVQIADPAIPGSPDSRETIAGCQLSTLHCSLTESSRMLVDGSLVGRMRPGAVLVNTARGDCMDLEALLAAPQLGGLGIDVFPEEPWPRISALARRENVLVTPHSAGYHDGLASAVTREIGTALRAWLAGTDLLHRLA